jgi:hypothetical protein
VADQQPVVEGGDEYGDDRVAHAVAVATSA